MTGEIAFRPARPSDMPHVFKSFVRSYRKSPYATGMSGAFLAELLQRLLDRGWLVEIAYPDGDDDAIAAWILYSEHTGNCGYIHVKSELRRCGIARALWKRHCYTYGMRTPFLVTSPNVAKILSEHGVAMQFRPYLPFAV